MLSRSYFMRLVFYNIRKSMILKIVYIGCFLNLPILIGIILSITLRKIEKIKYKKRKGKIIYLYKSIGIDDLLSSFKNTKSEYPIYILERIYFMKIFEYFVRDDTDDFHYIKKSSVKDKINYKNFMSKVILYLHKSINLKGIISSNFLYKSDREIQNLTSQINLPFIVIHKEGVRSKNQRLVQDYIYKNRTGRFLGNKILVYNEDEKISLVKNRVAFDNEIIVTGCPRLDKFFKIKKKVSRKRIVFFLVQENYGLPIYNKKWLVPKNLKRKIKFSNFTWKNIAKNYNERIIRFAKENPDYEIIVKGKIGYSQEQLKYFENSNIKNLKFINFGNSYELIKNCSIIVSFSSTVLLEAIAANKMIFSPISMLQKNIRYKNFLLEAKNLFLPMESLNKIDNKLKLQFLKNLKKNQKNRTKFLTKYLGNKNGKSSLNVAKNINKVFHNYHVN